MTTKINTILLVSAISILLAPQAQARDIEKIFSECGIGAELFPTTPAASAISNIIWDLGTTATLSDISSPESCKGGKAQVAMLIGSSFDTLETEISQGRGEYVSTLSKLSGKSVSNIRTQFSSVVASKNYPQMTTSQKAQKLFDITDPSS